MHTIFEKFITDKNLDYSAATLVNGLVYLEVWSRDNPLSYMTETGQSLTDAMDRILIRSGIDPYQNVAIVISATERRYHPNE